MTRMLEAASWLKEEGHDALDGYLNRKLVVKDGRPSNRKFELRLPSPNSKLFRNIVWMIGIWAIQTEVDAIVSSERVASRYAYAAVREFPNLPVISFSGPPDRREYNFLNGAKKIINGRVPTIGILQAERATGLDLLRVSSSDPLVRSLPDANKRALVVVDRGQFVPGVGTVEEVKKYINENPYAPRPHVSLPFPCDAMIEYPLPFYVPEGE